MTNMLMFSSIVSCIHHLIGDVSGISDQTESPIGTFF
jgi:hypothetical protein